MRMLLRVSIPHEKFNEAVRKGTAGQILGRILEDIKPEAAYFTEMDGKRTAILIVNLEEPSRIPALAEPFFLQFDADCEWHIVMKPDDMKKAGLEAIGKKWA